MYKNKNKMTKHDAGNLLMVGASLIVALHIGLFSIWVNAISGGLIKLADKISMFGILFMILNLIFWVGSRQHFDKLLSENVNEPRLNPYVSAGLIIPMLVILFGWYGAYESAEELSFKKENYSEAHR